MNGAENFSRSPGVTSTRTLRRSCGSRTRRTNPARSRRSITPVTAPVERPESSAMRPAVSGPSARIARSRHFSSVGDRPICSATFVWNMMVSALCSRMYQVNRSSTSGSMLNILAAKTIPCDSAPNGRNVRNLVLGVIHKGMLITLNKVTAVDLGLPGVRGTPDVPARPDSPLLVDRFGRVAKDLRVSLTDRCNLRCTYCMPAEGLDWLADERILTDDEVVRLVDIAVRLLGIDDVRFTGGEPLVRRGFVDIVSRCAELEPRPQLSVTTNALGLRRQAVALKAAGLDRVNVSLDTVRPETFAAMTLRD